MPKQTEQEINEQYEKERPWIELWDALLHFGLALFEPDGRGVSKRAPGTAGIGLEHIEGLRTYFENIESYRRAGRVHELIQEYRKRWPDAKSENSLIDF